ncbi:MAG: restriction endonuclease [Gemmatimonadaceae bacterium]|nr:restriction endonuclease [Gemmatimonadaceae bacterium]MBA3557847.1 restriction endonuclease [Gemmatimonadaceae bacterium]
MTIPSHEDAMLPVLSTLADGAERHRRALADVMADHFRLTPEERAQLLPSGKAPVIRSRTGWALSYMKQAGLVSTPRRGWYQITPQGEQVLAASPSSIDNDFLMRFEGFRDFRSRSRNESGSGEVGDEVDSAPETLPKQAVPPDEALDSAYVRLRTAVEAELVDTIKNVSPRFFEELVIDLLVRMGYGGNRAEAARAIGRSGDGGIDGVIDEDRLGLDSIYVQAKRWEASIGRPEIQKFAGALQGQRATKGIFITTSTFTREADEYAQRIGSRIVLIDGRRLASLMFEHDVGVSPKRTYIVKDVDGDYFEES